METKPPLPPFTLEIAKAKVQAAENGWNTRNPEGRCFTLVLVK